MHSFGATPSRFHCSTLASDIAKSITNRAINWEEVREICDVKTRGQLDCIALDILTDMVALRIGLTDLNFLGREWETG